MVEQAAGRERLSPLQGPGERMQPLKSGCQRSPIRTLVHLFSGQQATRGSAQTPVVGERTWGPETLEWVEDIERTMRRDPECK